MEDVAGRRGAFWRWFPAAVYALAIFVASSIPAQSLSGLSSLWDFDKLLHGIAFAGFAALLMRALGRFWPAVALAAAWGGLDELHQHFTPGRSSDVKDFLADVAGALVGAFLVMLVARVAKGRSEDGAPTQVP